MKKVNNFRKGQALPLNTIVIAVLVIIVLVVIIAFFVSRTSTTGEELNKNSVSQCSLDNPAVRSLGYTSVSEEKVKIPGNPSKPNQGEYDPKKNNCKSGEEIRFIRTEESNNYIICCGTK